MIGLKNKKLFNCIFGAFYVLYLLVLLRITVFRSGFSLDKFLSGGSVNLIPIADLARTLISSPRSFVYLFFGNIIWFIPQGFCITAFRGKSILFAVICGAALSLFIEVFQFLFATGVAEIDDLLLNTLGAFVGAVMGRYIKNKKSH